MEQDSEVGGEIVEFEISARVGFLRRLPKLVGSIAPYLK